MLLISGLSLELGQGRFSFNMQRIDISKYLGIPYEHHGSDNSGLDCYGMLRLFYKEEFDIEIPNYEYDENWCSVGLDWIRKYYKNNWILIDSPERYSVVGFKMPGYKVEHHLGIILHDLDMFLHSPFNQAVCVNKLSQPVWKRSISSFYKIKGISKC